MTKEEWLELGILLDNVKSSKHSAAILCTYNMGAYGAMNGYLQNVVNDVQAIYDMFIDVHGVKSDDTEANNHSGNRLSRRSNRAGHSRNAR